MSRELGQDLARHLPFLRRYARALSGDQRTGDALVRAALQRLLSRREALHRDELKVMLYRALSEIFAAGVAGDAGQEAGGTLENAGIVAGRLQHLSPPRRQLLLLTTLEGFPLPQAAVVVGMAEDQARRELAAAKAELRAQPPTRVLIIEDEPVIALDIQAMVERSGHEVVGIATTHREAVDLARRQQPGLVLADIQLADDSSGIEAVNEILAHYEVPVIFITAFPDRLLTGERPEPAFLITKPFDPEILHVSIAQALAASRA